MRPTELDETLAAWPQMAGALYVLHTEEEYERLIAFLDSLIDVVGEDESHPLASLMEIVGVLIERYEDEHVAGLAGSGCRSG